MFVFAEPYKQELSTNCNKMPFILQQKGKLEKKINFTEIGHIFLELCMILLCGCFPNRAAMRTANFVLEECERHDQPIGRKTVLRNLCPWHAKACDSQELVDTTPELNLIRSSNLFLIILKQRLKNSRKS